MGGRSRSLSASSHALLKRHLSQNRLSGFEDFSQAGEYPQSPGAETPSSTQNPTNTSPGSSNAKKPVLGIKTEQPLTDPYYRPPRARRATIDPYTPGARSRQSGVSGEWGSRPFDDWPESASAANDSGEGPSSGRETPSPAYFRHVRGGSDPEPEHDPRSQTDYSTREVDYYYGVRGPALSNLPTRKRKTGPADPMGPVSNATSWFQRIVGSKNKEKGKGFEVVRSSRAPANMMAQPRGREEEGEELQTSPPMSYPPYRDSPDPQALAGAESDVQAAERTKKRMPLDGPWDESESDAENEYRPTSSEPPFLRPISRTPSITLPDRTFSHRSPDLSRSPDLRGEVYEPNLPRKSSRRSGSRDISFTSPQLSPRLPSHFETERPTSMGLVSHRMTGDSVFQSHLIGEGSKAEFVHGGERTMSFE